MSEKMRTTLGQLAKNGPLEFGDGYRTKRAELSGTGFAIVRAGDISDSTVVLNPEDHISPDYRQAIGDKIARPGDVLLTTKGTVGRRAIFPTGLCAAAYSPQICYFRTRPDTLLPRYFYYWLGAAEFNGQASHLQHSTDMAPYISLSQLSLTTITVPPLPEQQAIAEVLGALDDKIAANRALITRSRELVQSVFARHANGLPFQPLSSVAEINANSIEPAAGKFRYIDISSVADGDYFQPTQLDWRDAPSRARRRVQFGDTIWSTVRPNLRAHALVLEDSQDLVASTGLATITARSGDFAFVFAATDTPGFADHLISNATGSAYPAVSAAALAAAPVPQFDQKRNAAFEKSAAPLLLLSASATQESRTLASLRDTLLPALMSGRLRVRDAEKQVEEAL